ncbi:MULTISPECIES: type VI secretion system tip protein VgrG [unclassified Caballeronia]|uniref:type VI secretion system Vgr family protein n=1 Tax=unclassified Caballeronia TaxID=2646786 RepID=UPI002855173D|nr:MULTISPECIES: type VI secretion system tip protein VgrG [unclassified Caballeronia]MDR5750511.1 type VI secretion system tip protein VgrG [Caballeronia sp. LZ024]MDR5842456.1 type VI secretion system tip protein VgrG [Caballeronia sp. LZ031]
MKFTPRKPQQVDRGTGTGGANPLPVVSVVSWEVHEEICEPYRIKAVISTPEPVSRKKVLGHLAEFSIQPEDGRELRTFNGFVSRFDLVSESRDGCTYHVVVRQRLAMLDGPSNCVTYQRMTSWEIIKAILERHEIRFWMQIEFRLKRVHPRHDFRFQFNLGDWAYIRLEMEQAGLFCFTTADEHGEVLVIADDVDGYERPPVMVLDRPTAGLSTFEESIFSFRVRTRTVPESFAVADYNPESAWEVLRNESRVVPDDETMVGTPYVWGTHHGDAEGAKREAQLRHEAALAQQVRYKVKSTVLALRPGRIVRSDRALEDTTWGMFVTKVVHSGARDASYMNRFTAIPADRPYRMAIDANRWPRIHGTLGATICSPDKYKFAFLTDKGEYVARFHCDFGNWPKGAESVPLRLAKPFSGKNYTGMHMPALDGDEALVGFREGNPNKPILVGFMPNSQRPDLINSSRRRISRNEIRTQSGNKLWLDDWDDQQGIELSTEHSGRSQLNLGFIPDRELKERGTGAELRTSGHLVGRGGAGAMLTAYNQAGGSGKVLAMDETDAQLKDHQVFVKSLADSAGASKASPADLDAQKGINDGLKQLKKPGVLVTGPGPVGVASGDGVHLAADGSIIGTAKKGVHFSTLKRFTVAARDMVSMFSQKGMSLITSAGDFVAQAQRGRMQLAAQEDMSIESVNGVVHVKAAKEIILNVNGTYVKISGGGVEIGSRGGVVYRTAGVTGTGPAQMDLSGAAFAPAFVPYTTACEVWRTNPDFVPPPAPVSEMDGPESMGTVPPAPSLGTSPVPPSALGDFFSGNRNPLKVDDPENAPKTGLEPNPNEYPRAVKLEQPAPCNWVMSAFSTSATLHRETPTYHRYGSTDSAPEKDANNDPISWAGPANTTCHFDYDSDAKTLTAKVVIALVPKLLVKMNPATKQPLRDAAGRYVVVNYETVNNGANSGKTFAQQGLMLIDRNVSDVNGSVYKNLIETTLNKGGYKLILDGCQKGASCGCRVPVKFCADIRVVTPAEAEKLNADTTINLFPNVDRADAKNWPAADHYGVDNSGQTVAENWQVKAHETGHLFAFPDEYWKYGGFVHKQYVKSDMTLDFARGRENSSDNKTWQIESQDNLMGYGCNKSSAIIQPYYLEYIRQWFSSYTNKKWRVGYENKA